MKMLWLRCIAKNEMNNIALHRLQTHSPPVTAHNENDIQMTVVANCQKTIITNLKGLTQKLKQQDQSVTELSHCVKRSDSFQMLDILTSGSSQNWMM